MSTSKPSPLSRRALLQSAGAGFGSLALAGLLAQTELTAGIVDRTAPGPLSPKPPHFPAKAKRIVFLFMEGAMSSLDTFEYKAALQKDAGKSGPGGGVLTPSQFKFKQYGKTGTWFSELLPNIATHADDLCWLRGKP